MTTHWLNVIVALVVVTAFAVPRTTTAQSDIYQFTEKRSQNAVIKYCGKNLSNALQLICNGNYNSMFKKSGQEMEMDDYPFAYDDSYPGFRSRESAYAMMGRFGGGRFRRQSRGVHDECCVKSCSVQELTSYCGR